MKYAANCIVECVLGLALLFPMYPQHAHADRSIAAECQPIRKSKKLVRAQKSLAKRKTTGRKYSQKELDRLMETIGQNLKNSQAPMVSMFGVGKNCVNVCLRWNTKENQRKFLRYVCNSAAIKFDKTLDPVTDNKIGVNSYNGVTITPKEQIYSVDSTKIEFTITNESGSAITYGERFYVTAKNEKGEWYRLPGPSVFTGIGHALGAGKSSTIAATLFPKILANKPGVYRFFFPLRMNGEKIWFMTNFTLK